MLAHLRTEAYPVYQEHQYPPRLDDDETELSYEKNNLLIDESKRSYTLICGAPSSSVDPVTTHRNRDVGGVHGGTPYKSNLDKDLPPVKDPHQP